jgi:hypothetical protein
MANLAETLRQVGYVTPQGQVTGPNAPLAQQLKNYVTNVIPTAAQNLAQQRADIDAGLTMGDQGIQVGDREAFERQMAQVPNLMGLTAYHGTPHTIKNKFDISKVGSGSTSTNFGHGIYFAESPDVAGMYMVSRNKIAGPTEGNLYKVDIPDELIPKMVNWYEEVPESVAKPLSNKALEQFGSGLSNTSGERLYKDLVFSFKQKGSKTPETDASKWLSEQGVAGIKYENMQMVKGQGRGTNNYVMFDPTQVKMLNKYENKLNRKKLIESQIKNLQNTAD